MLLTDRKVGMLKDLLPLLEQVAKVGRAAAVRGRGRRGRGARHADRQPDPRRAAAACAVKAPGFGDRRKAMLADMAVLTGGAAGLRGDSASSSRTCSSRSSAAPSASWSDKDTTTIIGGAGDARRDRRRAWRRSAREIEQGDQRLRQGEARGAAGQARRAAWR
ncbi:MAG: hypothetical protein MZV65_37960 [Chromatiales bacterium]|nr:hypothetical protein [Chromatiales bacterium]